MGVLGTYGHRCLAMGFAICWLAALATGPTSAAADTPGTTLSVTPSATLPSPASVNVSGTGFGPNGTLRIVECTSDFVTCSDDIGSSPTSPTGTFGPVAVSVAATFTPDGGGAQVDCRVVSCAVYAQMDAQPQFAHQDITFAAGPTCTITGTAAGEKLTGTAGNDVICGLGGNDRINGKGGDDTLFGDAGNDELIGEGGVDALDGGGDTNDTANYNPGANQGVAVDLANGTVANDGRGFVESIANVERVEGARSFLNDLVGDSGPNKLIGGLLADVLAGREGDDLLRGERERSPSGMNDVILGNEGSDEIFPGLGSNIVDAGQGAGDSDTVNYGALGVASGVTVDLSDGDGSATGAVTDILGSVENVSGTPNVDSITVSSNGVAGFVRGREGNDLLFTADGDALDTINGSAGGDTCGYDPGDTVLNCP